MSQTIKSYRDLFVELTNSDDEITKQIIEELKLEYDLNHEHDFKLIENNLTQGRELKCPKCGSRNYVHNGFTKNGTRRYKCKCGKVFSASTNSLFLASKVNLKAWFSFIEGIISETSIQAACLKAKISLPTGYYWIKKIFSVLNNFQDLIILDGKIYLDETYIPVETSKEKTKHNRKMRGLSRNKICVVLIINDEKLVAIKCGFGKPSANKVYDTSWRHIKEGSTLIHDEEKAHSYLIEQLDLNSIAYNAAGSKVLKKIAEQQLKPINDECRELKYFLSKHKGLNKDNLQDYLNLYSFIKNCKKKNSNLYFATNLLIKLLFLSDKKLKF